MHRHLLMLERRLSKLEKIIFEGKKDLEDLRVYLGDDLFDAYMNIRNRIPSEFDLNKQFPKFTVEYILEKPENARQFLKKYSNLRKHNIISNLGDYLFIKVPPEASIDHLEDSLLDYDDMRNYVFATLDSFRDFEKLKRLSIDDIRSFVDSYTSVRTSKDNDKVRGARKIYEDSDWVVYHITEYNAAKYYGKGTKWCIAGNYPGYEGRGEDYFNDYINTEGLDGGYYFYINKQDPSKKYCLLQAKDGTVKSIWDQMDTNRGSSINAIKAYGIELPEVSGINLHNDSLADYITDTTTNGVYPELKTFLMNNQPTKDELNEALFTICSNSTDCDKVVKLLLKYGADLNYKDAVFFAVRHPDLYNTVKAILDSGFNVNTLSKSRKRDTLLHRAAYANAINLVKLLLDYGADRNIKDTWGDTPLEAIKNSPLCPYSDYKNVIELLETNI